MKADPTGPPTETSDFHLVENSGGWRLTIRASDRLLALLKQDTAAEQPAEFTVHVEPNLLPGAAFDVTVGVAEPDGDGRSNEARPPCGSTT